jgi:hypothetical protein
VLDSSSYQPPSFEVAVEAAGSKLTLIENAPLFSQGINELRTSIFQKILAKYHTGKS